MCPLLLHRVYVCMINVSNSVDDWPWCICVHAQWLSYYKPLNIRFHQFHYSTFTHHIIRNAVEMIRYVRVSFSLLLWFVSVVLLFDFSISHFSCRVLSKRKSLDLAFSIVFLDWRRVVGFTTPCSVYILSVVSIRKHTHLRTHIVPWFDCLSIRGVNTTIATIFSSHSALGLPKLPMQTSTMWW